jgi:GH43 family beta-xylosidase
MFTNPVAPSGADPWVTQWKGQYLYVRSAGGQLFVDRSTNLHQLGQHGSQMVYQPPAGTNYSQNLWAPELHYLDNKWYLYVAADNGPNANHRMHVLEGTSQDPQGTYLYKGQISDSTNRWAIDGNVMQLNGSKYFVWSGWNGTTNVDQRLYIAPMSNPWTISGPRVQIAAPTQAWEQHGLPLNEGPTTLQRDGKTHIIYSGSAFWMQEYALGRLTLTGTNPLDPTHWTKTVGPVFAAGNGVVGTGHASFTKSPDGGQDWIVYHAHANQPFQDVRDVRIQQFHWNGDDSPNFGPPAPSGAPLSVPSGRAVVTFVPNSSFERVDVTSAPTGGNAFGVDKMKTIGPTASTGVTANDGRFHAVIANGDGRQMAFIGSSGLNAIYNEIGQVVKPGTYTFSAGVALSPTQVVAAGSAPTTYQLRLESVGLLPNGQPNENDKIVLATQTVNSSSLSGATFTNFAANATIPLLSDRYNTFVRLGVYSSGVGGSASWSAKLDSFALDFAALNRPQTPAVAYWRFEEGPAGASLTGTNGNNGLPHTTTLDHAGGNDNLRTYNYTAGGFDTSPKYSHDVPAAVIPATGTVNEHSFDFTPNQDVYTALPGDLNGRHFGAFTIEASFKLDNLDRFHGLVGKDGKPTSSLLAPLQLKARDDNDRVQIEVLDGAGNERQVSSVAPLSADQWYHVAAVSDGTTMSLYLDRNDGLGFVLQGTTPVSGALIDGAATWTVGRGFYNGGIADWTDGKIDEVRITDAAIDPTQFLFFDPAGPPVWNVNAGGNFSAQSNWSRATPDSINAVAYFTDAIRSPKTIDVDAPRTLAGLVFNNTNSYTLAGTSVITIDTNGATGVINSFAGAHTIAAPVVLRKNTTIGVAEQFTIAGDLAAAPGVSDVAVTKSGTGGLKLKNIRAKSLNVAAGNVEMLPDSSAAGASALDTLTLAAGSRFDLAANKLVLRAMPAGTANAAGTYGGVQGLVQRAYNFGAWDTPGLTTSQELAGQNAGSLSGTTTIGVATAEQVLFIAPSETAIVAGQTVSGTSVIAMYTYAGDLNFDGLVDGADYGVIDNYVQFPGTDGYANGDFNYDCVIDGADYGVIDNTVQLQGAPLPGVFDSAPAPAASLTAVPEPAACAFTLMAFAAAALPRRRRGRA